MKETEQTLKKSVEQLKAELLEYFFDSRLKGEEDRFMQTVEAYATAKAKASCEATLIKASENAKFDHAWWMQTGAHRCSKSSITDPSNIVIV